MDDKELRDRLKRYFRKPGDWENIDVLFLSDLFEFAQISESTGRNFYHGRTKLRLEGRIRLERAVIAAETGALTKKDGLLWLGPETKAMQGLISIDVERGFGVKMTPKRHETYQTLPSIKDIFGSKGG